MLDMLVNASKKGPEPLVGMKDQLKVPDKS